MNDAEFLSWLADRLVRVYGESENVDFVLRLRGIASKQRVKDVAPEMLEALKRLMLVIPVSEHHYGLASAITYAHATIAKATGVTA